MSSTHNTTNRSFATAQEGLECWSDQHRFSYEIAYPSRIDMLSELNDVFEEVMIDDIYRLQQISQPGDVWIDVGSHLGFFSIAAMQAGSHVKLAVDADREIAQCARYNTAMFMAQSVARGLISTHIPEPFVAVEKVSSATQLIDFNFKAWMPEYRRRCLKLDIQGDEVRVFADRHASALAEQYDLIVLEYHQPIASEMSMLMENAGWSIINIQSHSDSLLGIDTNIIWAESR